MALFEAVWEPETPDAATMVMAVRIAEERIWVLGSNPIEVDGIVTQSERLRCKPSGLLEPVDKKQNLVPGALSTQGKSILGQKVKWISMSGSDRIGTILKFLALEY